MADNHDFDHVVGGPVVILLVAIATLLNKLNPEHEEQEFAQT